MAKSIQKMTDEFTVLTVHEVAEYLRMTEAKVYRRLVRFRKDLLDKWLVDVRSRV